jgi:hypothetical protein
MVAEESGMKISDAVCSEMAENPLPADPAGDSRAQIALAFDSSGNHEIVAEVPGADHQWCPITICAVSSCC